MIPINSFVPRPHSTRDKRFFERAYWRKLTFLLMRLAVEFGHKFLHKQWGAKNLRPNLLFAHDFIHCFAEENLVFGSRPRDAPKVVAYNFLDCEIGPVGRGCIGAFAGYGWVRPPLATIFTAIYLRGETPILLRLITFHA